MSLFPTASVRTDRRRIDYTPRPDLLTRLRALVPELRRVELEIGAVLTEIDRVQAHVDVGAAKVEELAQRFGLAPEEARRYRDLGRAVDVQPSVAERVAQGALATSRAAVLAPVLDGSGEPQSELDRVWGVLPPWVETAERTPTRELRKMVRREMARRRSGEDVQDVTLHATETTREHFERARVLASRQLGRRLSNDETFRVVVEDYVDRHDPLLVGEGTRRVGPTEDLPGERYIPVGVRREVRRRAGDRCEHPGCEETTFLQFAHRVAHARGGAREADDLLLLCWRHHAMLDAGHIRVLGPTADPVWIHPEGYVLTRASPGGVPPGTDEERSALRDLREQMRRGLQTGDDDAADAGVPRAEARGPEIRSSEVVVAGAAVFDALISEARIAETAISEGPVAADGAPEEPSRERQGPPGDARGDGPGSGPDPP